MTVHAYDVKNTKTKHSFMANYAPEGLMNICTGNVCNANCTAVNIALNQTTQ